MQIVSYCLYFFWKKKNIIRILRVNNPVLIITAADNIIIFYLYFLEKIRRDISC